MSSAPTIIKVGGSLLDWPELPQRLAHDLANRTGPFVLIAGGGPSAAVVRDLDRIHGFGEERSHWLCLRALDLTAHVLGGLMNWRVVEDVSEPRVLPDPFVLAPRQWLEKHDVLPHTWDATTDSIAAALALHLEARELVLLKSAPIPVDTSFSAAARLGLVDRVFPDLARRLPHVVYRNLRDPRDVDHSF
jgi:aspartokinase-like uncharacterized kinase